MRIVGRDGRGDDEPVDVQGLQRAETSDEPHLKVQEQIISKQAEIKVKVTGVHLCCQGCVDAVDAAVKNVAGVTCRCDMEKRTVALTAHDDAAAQKALGEYGKLDRIDVYVSGREDFVRVEQAIRRVLPAAYSLEKPGARSDENQRQRANPCRCQKDFSPCR